MKKRQLPTLLCALTFAALFLTACEKDAGDRLTTEGHAEAVATSASKPSTAQTTRESSSKRTEKVSSSASPTETTKRKRKPIFDSPYLQILRENNGTVAAPKIITAITEKDVAALEEMMCLNIKQNVEGLSEKIDKLVNSIEGEVLGVEEGLDHGGGGYSGKQADGRQMLKSGIDLFFTTSTGIYDVTITWEDANNFAPEEMGIRTIALGDPSGNVLVLISATEGVCEWHD